LEVVGLGAAGGNEPLDGTGVTMSSGIREGARILLDDLARNFALLFDDFFLLVLPLDFVLLPFEGEPLLAPFVLYLLFGDPFAFDDFDS
jgi:hypothetical protein